MKKVYVLFILVLLMLLVTMAANADNYTVSSDSTLTISTVGPHTVTGTATNAHINCTVPGVTLTLNGVSVTCSSGNPISFTGAGNQMILADGTTNTFRCTVFSYSTTNNAAVRVEDTTELTISGTGTLNAYAGDRGAGIGGGDGNDGGIITISSGTINATGGYLAAGIGGGGHYDYDTASSGGDGGTITINGGTVTAIGGDEEGVGIGSGFGFNYTSGNWGTINITGGVVKAYADDDARGAGIGGSAYSPAGTITISGGLVYAQGYSGGKDIGDGGFMSAGTITIEGDAAVFVARNSYSTPTLTDGHENKSNADFNANSVYGVVVPDSDFTNSSAAFFRLCTLMYNSNGGTGTTPDTLIRHYNTTTQVDDGTGLTYTGLIFSGWNTTSSGTGTAYAAGATYTFNTLLTALFAQWAEIPPTGDANPYINVYVILAAAAAVILAGLTIGRRTKRRKANG